MTKTLDGVAVSRLQVDDGGQPLGGCVHSYIASLDGLMRGAGWWTDDIAVLAGVSGIAFHFVVHRTWCASSTNAYDWVAEHEAAAARLGMSSVAVDHWQADGFADAQAKAISTIKDSIDSGVAAIVWLPSPRHMGFGLVTGYDDEEGVFVVDDELGDCDPVRYANFGRTHDLPWLHYQVVTDRHPIDVAAAVRGRSRWLSPSGGAAITAISRRPRGVSTSITPGMPPMGRSSMVSAAAPGRPRFI